MKHSIKLRLLLFILIGFFLSWITISVLTWWHARSETDLLFDEQLAQMANLIAVVLSHETEEQDLTNFAFDILDMEQDSPLMFQVWNQQGLLIINSSNSPQLPTYPLRQEGYKTEKVGNTNWRIFKRQSIDKRHIILVAQMSARREARLHQFISELLSPLLLIIPMGGFFWWVIEESLLPMKRLSYKLRNRNSDNLGPLTMESIPIEAVPLVDSINHLLQQLQSSLDRYSRFTADAAHELRTPIAGTVVQIHAALKSTDEEERVESLKLALLGLARLHRLVEQLLELSRLSTEDASRKMARFDLTELAIELISEYAPESLAKNVSLELDQTEQINLVGHRDLLSIALRNLIENALKSSSEGGVVTLGLSENHVHIECCISDTGTGIPDAEKQSVFERFHRLPGAKGEGSGLGFSIVQAVIQLHSGTIELKDRTSETGLSVILKFPKM